MVSQALKKLIYFDFDIDASKKSLIKYYMAKILKYCWLIIGREDERDDKHTRRVDRLLIHAAYK